mgnify:FL=1
MATEIIKTIRASGGDYTSRSAFEAAVPANLVTLDQQWSGVIDAFEDTIAVTVAGTTTDATRYVEFRVASGQGHAGKWDATKAKLIVSAGTAFYNDQPYTRIIGDQISDSANYDVTLRDNFGDFRGDKLILKETGTEGLAVLLNSNNSHLRNSVIYDSFVGIQNNLGANHYVYNCTIQNCTTGLKNVANTTIGKNILVKGGTTCFVFVAGTMNLSYCASSDATADDWGGTGNRISQTFTFVDETGDDFHLAVGDAGAKDYGVDLSGDANYPFSDDIDGQTRSGTWDIGADEYVAAGGETITIDKWFKELSRPIPHKVEIVNY